MQVHDIPNSYGNQAPNRDYIQTVNLSRIPIQACRPWVCRVCHGTPRFLQISYTQSPLIRTKVGNKWVMTSGWMWLDL